MGQMTAGLFIGEGKFTIEKVSIPTIKHSDDVLLEVEAASICGTDLQILKVPPGHPANSGIILGHEYMGRVAEAGKSVHSLKPGDRVVVDPNLTCSYCYYCRNGMPNMCENMTTLGIFINGGFAQYNIAPEKALHRIIKEMPSEQAVFAEPLSCVVNAVEKLKPQPGETAVVLGAGPIGLLFIQLLIAAGVKTLIVSEPVDLRSEVARESGAHVVVNPQKNNLREKVMELTSRGVDIAVDAVGSLFEDAVGLVRSGGRVMIFGQNETFTAKFKPYYITRYEKQILSSFIARYTFPRAIRILESGLLKTDKLVTHRLKLEDFGKGLELMRKGEAIKVVLKP